MKFDTNKSFISRKFTDETRIVLLGLRNGFHAIDGLLDAEKSKFKPAYFS